VYFYLRRRECKDKFGVKLITHAGIQKETLTDKSIPGRYNQIVSNDITEFFYVSDMASHMKLNLQLRKQALKVLKNDEQSAHTSRLLKSQISIIRTKHTYTTRQVARFSNLTASISCNHNTGHSRCIKMECALTCNDKQHRT